ncbi:hypothetical protein C808_05283 [Lachnospiraceae bacterium M18-1]|nr:hypothetical protein C808_05283 [Lachnospiraceae bacterium M18-1]
MIAGSVKYYMKIYNAGEKGKKNGIKKGKGTTAEGK